MRKIEEHEGKNISWSMMIYTKQSINQEITNVEKFNDTKILIDTNDKLPDDIISKKLWY